MEGVICSHLLLYTVMQRARLAINLLLFTARVFIFILHWPGGNVTGVLLLLLLLLLC